MDKFVSLGNNRIGARTCCTFKGVLNHLGERCSDIGPGLVSLLVKLGLKGVAELGFSPYFYICCCDTGNNSKCRICPLDGSALRCGCAGTLLLSLGALADWIQPLE